MRGAVDGIGMDEIVLRVLVKFGGELEKRHRVSSNIGCAQANKSEDDSKRLFNQRPQHNDQSLFKSIGRMIRDWSTEIPTNLSSSVMEDVAFVP
jgi:hypothetical protein